MDKADQMSGSFLGLAYGDILGCPTESMTQGEIQEAFGNYIQLPKEYPAGIIEKFPRLRPIGEYSDDTQQAMVLTLTCLQPGGWNKETFADILVSGMDNGSWRGFGNRFEEAVKSLKNGVSPKKSGSKSAGIGAAMRVAPAAIVYHANKDQLRKVVIEQSAITHADIRAIAIAYAISYIVAEFINGTSREKIIEQLSAEIFDFEDFVLQKYKDWDIDTDAEHEVSMTISYLMYKDIDNTSFIRERILDMSGTASPNDPYALAGGMHAIIMGLQKEVDPLEQLISICKIGSDTDTVAAMAGAILGARFGASWIPPGHMLDENRIRAYAESLVTGKPYESKEELLLIEKTYSK